MLNSLSMFLFNLKNNHILYCVVTLLCIIMFKDKLKLRVISVTSLTAEFVLIK